MVISFRENLAKKEIKPNIKIKLNEYKKSLKNNLFLSEWIKTCLSNEDFINYNLDKFSLKETALFFKNIKKTQNDFLIECRNFYKDNAIPEFFKIYADENCISEFFESYSDILYHETFKNASLAKLLIFEMLTETKTNINYEIFIENYESCIPSKNFFVKNDNDEFLLKINSKDKKINIENCKNEKYIQYFENRNKDKSLINLYCKEENIQNLNEIKHNMVFLNKTILESDKLNLKNSKNYYQIKCKKNELAFDDKFAYPVYNNHFEIYDILRK